MHFGEIENRIFLDAEHGVQWNPIVSGGQFRDLRFVQREGRRRCNIDGEGFGIAIFPVMIFFSERRYAQEKAFRPLSIVLKKNWRRLVEF